MLPAQLVVRLGLIEGGETVTPAPGFGQVVSALQELGAGVTVPGFIRFHPDLLGQRVSPTQQLDACHGLASYGVAFLWPLKRKPHAQAGCSFIDAIAARVGDTNGLHEGAARDTISRIGVMRCVRDIEELNLKSHLESFLDGELAHQTHIRVEQVRAPKTVDAAGSEPARRR